MKPDFLSLEFNTNPFPVLEWFRSNKPVYRHEETAVPCVSVFKYADVRYVCRNDNDFSFQGIANQDKPLVGGETLFRNPPEHTQMRGLFDPLFNRKRIHWLDEVVREKSIELLNKVKHGSSVNIVSDIADPLASFAMCKFLGLDHNDSGKALYWAREVVQNEGYLYFRKSGYSDREERLDRVFEEVREYIINIINSDSYPGENSALQYINNLHESNPGVVTRDIFIDIVAILSFAGVDTISTVIGSLIRVLLENPRQFQRLAADNNLLGPAIEETLRYYGCVKCMVRVATRNILMGDEEINTGDTVLVWMLSANRDGDVFENPDRFDISRGSTQHFGFGTGIHQCIGAMLARLVIKSFMTGLLENGYIMQPAGDGWLTPAQTPLAYGSSEIQVTLAHRYVSGRK